MAGMALILFCALGVDENGWRSHIPTGASVDSSHVRPASADSTGPNLEDVWGPSSEPMERGAKSLLKEAERRGRAALNNMVDRSLGPLPPSDGRSPTTDAPSKPSPQPAGAATRLRWPTDREPAPHPPSHSGRSASSTTDRSAAGANRNSTVGAGEIDRRNPASRFSSEGTADVPAVGGNLRDWLESDDELNDSATERVSNQENQDRAANRSREPERSGRAENVRGNELQSSDRNSSPAPENGFEAAPSTSNQRPGSDGDQDDRPLLPPDRTNDITQHMRRVRQNTVDDALRDEQPREKQYVPPLDRTGASTRQVAPVRQADGDVDDRTASERQRGDTSESARQLPNVSDRLNSPSEANSAQSAGDPTAPNDTNDASRSSTTAKHPWMPLLLTALGLFGSIGFNVYLGWIAWDLYSRYQEAVDDMQDLEERLETKSKQVAVPLGKSY